MITNEQFYHLHIHDQYSLLDGYGTADQYCEYAKELGLPGIALTNHGNMDGVLRWQKACKEHGLQGIYGCEAYMVPNHKVKKKGDKRFHICLYAKNMTGLHGIMCMLNAANMDGFYYRARIDPELILDNLEGVAVSTACLQSFVNMPGGIEFLQQLKARTEVFIEIMPHLLAMQKQFNQRCIKLAKDHDLPLIATNDCHYVKRDQSKLQEVLLAIQNKKKWNDKDRFKFSIDTLWLMTVDEMRTAFKAQGVIGDGVVEESMRNTALLAKVCNFEIKQQPVHLPKPYIKGYDHFKNEDVQLVQIAYDGFLRRKKMHDWITDDNNADYEARLEEELELICHLGFARYFLIVYELISWCRTDDIMTGPGRGSVGGSLVAFSMFLTSTDPIKYNLVFSRFISEGRIDLPDIDMDFEDIKRGRILEHLKKLYGEYNVVGLSTFGVMRGRGALRDISRVFDVPLVDVNKAASCIVTRSLGDARADFGIADAFDAFEDGVAFKKKYPNVSRIAMDMEGQIKGCGTHAAAMCVSSNPMESGLEGHYARRSAQESLVCNWDKIDAEHMGLMKLDVLGLNALTILAQARRLIKQRRGIDIDYDTLPLDDPKVYAEFNEGHGVGIFQFNGPGMMRICREIGVEDFEEVIAMNALHRPGPLRSGMVSTYRKRKHGIEPVTHIHPFIEGITKRTKGLILYQEQVMQLMYELGGLPWKTADMIRKVISKKKGEEQFLSFKQQFIDGCVNRKTVSADEATKIFDELQYFGCLAGDTVIRRISSNQYTKAELTIKEAYHYQDNTNFKFRGLQILSCFEDKQVRGNTIKKIYYTGKKQTYKVTTAGGKVAKPTAEHYYLTDKGYKQVKDFRVGKTMILATNFEKILQDHRTTGTGSGAHNEWHGKFLARGEARAKGKSKVCERCGNNQHVEMHHKDRDKYNNDPSNLEWLCRSCHRLEHQKTQPDTHVRFRKGYTTHYEEVVSVEKDKIVDTYDVEMVCEPANFIADGLVSHNSYGFNRSHACEYAMIACWEMWLKVYYPVDYMVTVLTHGNSEKKAEHIDEARRLGMSLLLPDINKSEATRWVADDEGNLLIPFSEVKGVGPTAAEAIVKTRGDNKFGRVTLEETGPFADFDDFERRVNKSKVNVRVRKLLQEVMCFEPVENRSNLDEGQLDNLSQYFKFNLSNDPMYRYHKVLRKLSTQIKIEPLNSVQFGGKAMGVHKYHFGIMDILKFGFKERGDGKNLRDVRGTAGDLGGVYGNFKDESDYTMLVFSQQFYRERKWEIEHCEGKWLLVHAKSTRSDNNIWTDSLWFGDDLLEGKVRGLPTQFLKDASYPPKLLNGNGLFLSACTDCALRSECSQVVYPAPGKFNAMIVGEAPGRDEDASGKPFVGDTGRILWTGGRTVFGLNHYGLKREHFHVTNVCKCWPSVTRTPKGVHVKACRKYLDAEIKAVKPFVILSFGNTGLRYFKDQDKGIMDMSGRTEWSDEHNCWICYCMHPASVLYHQENAEKVNAGIANFAEKVSVLGFGE